ncbi:MAG TPA: hypothetical protein ENN31_00945 [Candidatus Vogelbacteria bacterium]|nr:hypothetical protein [Candidatus Vogelbacteria bacterium]
MKKILFLIVIIFSLPSSVLAGQFSLQTYKPEIRVGEDVVVNLFLNSEGENINAFEGVVVFDNDLLEIEEIRDGNSIVNFWIERPTEQKNQIIFSGLTPGGFNGAEGLMFRIIFKGKNEGEAMIDMLEGRILKNDGLGTEADLKTRNLKMKITSSKASQEMVSWPMRDYEKPESFVPQIGRSEMIFDNQWFVAFITQDKISGIDRYEIKESRSIILGIFKPWQEAESPHILKDQDLKSNIYIKAIDRAGNERIEKISATNKLKIYENFDFWFIIVMIAIISLIIKKCSKKYSPQKK